MSTSNKPIILHLEDWKYYPTAIPDTSTKNETWIRMAALLKSRGIQNHYFHLALINPLLRGIDPYNKHLTETQKQMILMEIEMNPWYFFREVARIPIGSELILFEIYRPILSMLWCFFNGIDYILIMPRQIGKSVGCDWLEIWLLNYYYRKIEMTLYTKDPKLRTTNIKRIKRFMGVLPAWLLPQIKSGGMKDDDNTESLSCNIHENRYTTNYGQPDKIRAENIGRGDTLFYMHSDEGPWTRNSHISFPVLRQSTGEARKRADQAGILSGSLFTTTAGKKDSKEGKYFFNFLSDALYWDDAIYDSENKFKAREMVLKNAPGSICVINGTFNHRQAGKTDQWLRDRIRLSKDDPETIKRDLLNHWTSGSESQALSLEMLEIVERSECEPTYTERTVDLYLIRWYIEHHLILQYLNKGYFALGLDTSQMLGRDGNGLVLADLKDLSVVFTCNITEASIYRFIDWLAKLLIRYPRITLIIERKDQAQSIIDALYAKLVAENINPFRRIYNKIVDEKGKYQKDYEFIMKNDNWKSEAVLVKYKTYFGFVTASESRKFLYGTVINEAINSSGHHIKDKILSGQLKSLIFDGNRVDHPEGGHDDLVIAYLQIHWFVKYSKNLTEYGIDMFYALSDVVNMGAFLDDEQAQQAKEISFTKDEVSTIIERLKSAPGLLERSKYEKLLKFKLDHLKSLGDESLSMDAIMHDIKQSGVHKRSLTQSLNQLQLQRGISRGYL